MPLRDAPWATVADLHSRYLGGHTLSILAKITGRAPEPYLLDYSLVLMLDDRVIGFVLSREVEPDVVMTEAAVIIPEFRFDWANLLLKRAAAEQSVRYRRRAARFIAYDRHADTRKLARMVGADVIEDRVVPYKVLKQEGAR